MGALCNKGDGSLDMTDKRNRRLFGRKDFIGVITQRKIKDDYEIMGHLGEGSYAFVNLAKSKATGVTEVVKKIPLGVGDSDVEEMIGNEIQALIECVSVEESDRLSHVGSSKYH
jgi:serine/threonine protein kinase